MLSMQVPDHAVAVAEAEMRCVVAYSLKPTNARDEVDLRGRTAYILVFK